MTHETVIGMLDSPLDLAMLLLLLLALLLFGAKRLPEIARSLGTGMREFKEQVHRTDSALTRCFMNCDVSSVEFVLGRYVRPEFQTLQTRHPGAPGLHFVGYQVTLGGTFRLVGTEAKQIARAVAG
jgi:sec-independent protein translocase protein TatA